MKEKKDSRLRLFKNVCNRFVLAFSNTWLWFVCTLCALGLVVEAEFLAPTFTSGKWWTVLYPVLSSVLVGALVSFLFYFLVVVVPERRRKQLIKNNLRDMYLYLKRNIVREILHASKKGGRDDIQSDEATVQRLMDVRAFRDAFKDGREANEGWYAFVNQMGPDSLQYQEIILNLQILRRQIDYTLHNYPIVGDRLFGLMKDLEEILFRIERTAPDYEGVKSFCRFLWATFAGSSFSAGKTEYDPIEKMIAEM